jgi:septal ring factor EnvC (AmiA/AmiB activator)
MKQMHWSTFQTQFPDKAANYPGGEQAFTQQYIDRQNQWNQQGGPRQSILPLGLAGGLAGLFGQGGPRGGSWTGNPMAPPPKPIQSPQHGFHQFGEQLGGFGETLGGYGEQLGGYEEQLGGFGETLGGYGEQIGGFGEQMSGVEEAMGGFGEQFKGLNNRLDSMEKGIASLSDQLQPKQPQFGGYGGYGGMGGYGGFGGGFGYRGRYG